MKLSIDELKSKYPGALAWSFGDSPEMADELSDFVVKGIKTASCCSLSSLQSEELVPKIGSHHIILNGKDVPVCVIRLTLMRLVRFSAVTEEFARKEGEGDLSLSYWRKEHKAFFTREGSYSDDMELVAEEYELIEVL